MEPVSDITGSRGSNDVITAVSLSPSSAEPFVVSFRASSVPDACVSSLANPAKRAIFPSSSDKKLPEVILICSATSNIHL